MKKSPKKLITIIVMCIMLVSMSLPVLAITSFPHPPHNQNLTGSRIDSAGRDEFNCTVTGCKLIILHNRYQAFCGNCQARNGDKILSTTAHTIPGH
ncbi:MAG: hypothetical protein FWE14_06300 [Lachnospiraceae bacterium]|nr:hypothetical protein [Lachnospiraceae bacterium]